MYVSFDAQKPLSISQIKRNPFKKTSDSGKKSISNPLKHLTDSALGYDSQEPDSQVIADSQLDNVAVSMNDKENSNDKTNPSVCTFKFFVFSFESKLNDSPIFNFQTPKPSFLKWYGTNKIQLQKEKPELIPSELTKYAMGKYKEIYSNGPSVDASSKSDGIATKRKIDVENGSESGVAKLAKFNFSK